MADKVEQVAAAIAQVEATQAKSHCYGGGVK